MLTMDHKQALQAVATLYKTDALLALKLIKIFARQPDKLYAAASAFNLLSSPLSTLLPLVPMYEPRVKRKYTKRAKVSTI